MKIEDSLFPFEASVFFGQEKSQPTALVPSNKGSVGSEESPFSKFSAIIL